MIGTLRLGLALLGTALPLQALAPSPANLTALRGLKSDRFQTAHAPLTPMRRQKRAAAHDLARSPLESVAQKRKASAAVHDALGDGDAAHCHHAARGAEEARERGDVVDT